jgi:folate-dependent phosphoribosylglycinamide formyltransferase PurN
MDKEKLNIILFASGTKDGGGSGVENLKDATRRSLVDANIVAVVSNHEHGGVQEHSRRLGIPFIYFPEPYTAEMYRSIVERTSAGLYYAVG